MSAPKVVLVTGASSGFGAMTVRGRNAKAAADPSEVARQIVKVVDMQKGSRPFRVYVDPADDGAEDGSGSATRSASGSISGSDLSTCSA
ncbi:MAG TPA: hypothetical protein VMS92_07385 [Mycobacterium sp.]|nr:hypothetical protein [Mycobacterium sp.]